MISYHHLSISLFIIDIYQAPNNLIRPISHIYIYYGYRFISTNNLYPVYNPLLAENLLIPLLLPTMLQVNNIITKDILMQLPANIPKTLFQVKIAYLISFLTTEKSKIYFNDINNSKYISNMLT